MAENMKLFYSKSEAAKGGRPTCNPNSATQKIKEYVSVRIHGSSSHTEEDEETLIQPEPKIRERRISETSVGIESGICAFLINEQKEIKQKQREQKMLDASRARLDKANKKSGDKYGNKKSISTTIRVEKTYNMPLQQVSPTTEEKSMPSLRRVKSFGDLKEANRVADTKVKDRGEEYLNRLLVQRQAIRDGNLEKVIPPPSPQKAKLLLNGQKVSGKIAHSKSSSASSRLNSYLGTGADLLDATRRDLTSNLRKSIERVERVVSTKFDSFGRYSSGHGNNWDDDSDSDESFYCIGESRLSQLDKARRISGYGTDPWTDGPQKECRICRKASPAGVRGLCLQCEKDFRRPKAAVFDDSDDEPKPPPPLKIKKTAGGSENTQFQVREFHGAFMDDEVETTGAQKKQQTFTTEDHKSQKAYIDDGLNTPEKESEYVSIYERWQTPELRVQYRNPEYEKTRWSVSLLKTKNKSAKCGQSLRSKFNQQPDSPVEDEDTAPLVGQDGKQSKESRNSNGNIRSESFYAYWEEVFEDDEKSTKSLKKQNNRYQKV